MRNVKLHNLILPVILLALFVLIFVSRTGEKGQRLREVTPDNNLTVTPTSVRRTTITPASSPTIVIVAPTTTPIPPTPIPGSFYIRDIIGHGQYFALGCEASAAVDLAGYYDIQIYQYDFQHALPLSDNPDLGFVGDAKGPWGQVPPYAYGVHAAPVVILLQKYGVDVEGGKGYTLEEMKEQLVLSKPVIVWVIGNMEGGVPAEYTDSQGNTTIVAAFEHVVILTGYDEDSVRYLNNGKFYEVQNEVFINSWGVLGNMAVFHK
jgi:uncharacterized protein YvpB